MLAMFLYFCFVFLFISAAPASSGDARRSLRYTITIQKYYTYTEVLYRSGTRGVILIRYNYNTKVPYIITITLIGTSAVHKVVFILLYRFNSNINTQKYFTDVLFVLIGHQ